MIHIDATVSPPQIELSPRIRCIDNMFGIIGEHRPNSHVLASVPNHGITLVVGPSGSGKSLLLKKLLDIRSDARTLRYPSDDRLALIDLFPGSLQAGIGWFGRFGLAEAWIIRSPFYLLSEGQRARALLALAMWEKPHCLIIDDFLITLDTQSARIVSYNFQKLARKHGISAVLASPNWKHILPPLAPDAVIRVGHGGNYNTTLNDTLTPHLAELAHIKCSAGTLNDYRRLSQYHYAPDVSHEVLGYNLEIITARCYNRIAAVAISSPPFQSSFEYIPLFNELNKRLILRRRTIVHPDFRGFGITKKLQPRRPGAHAIVSVAVMSNWFPFPSAAGYRRLAHPRNRLIKDHAKLLNLLSSIDPSAVAGARDYCTAQRLYEDAPERIRDELRRTVERITTHNNLATLRLMSSVASVYVATADWRQYRRLFTALVSRFPTQRTGELIAESLPLRLAVFAKSLK